MGGSDKGRGTFRKPETQDLIPGSPEAGGWGLEGPQCGSRACLGGARMGTGVLQLSWVPRGPWQMSERPMQTLSGALCQQGKPHSPLLCLLVPLSSEEGREWGHNPCPSFPQTPSDCSRVWLPKSVADATNHGGGRSDEVTSETLHSMDGIGGDKSWVLPEGRGGTAALGSQPAPAPEESWERPGRAWCCNWGAEKREGKGKSGKGGDGDGRERGKQRRLRKRKARRKKKGRDRGQKGKKRK